jgi:hypothetical protein
MTKVHWATVQIGDILRLGGFAYEVMAEDRVANTVTVRKPDGSLFTNARPDALVERIFSAEEAMSNAESVIVTRLGGVVSGRQRADGSWTMPESYPEPGSLLAHLMIGHGITEWSEIDPDDGGTESLRAVTKYHARKHDPGAKQGEGYLPHVHDPLFLGSTEHVRQSS